MATTDSDERLAPRRHAPSPLPHRTILRSAPSARSSGRPTQASPTIVCWTAHARAAWSAAAASVSPASSRAISAPSAASPPPKPSTTRAEYGSPTQHLVRRDGRDRDDHLLAHVLVGAQHDRLVAVAGDRRPRQLDRLARHVEQLREVVAAGQQHVDVAERRAQHRRRLLPGPLARAVVDVEERPHSARPRARQQPARGRRGARPDPARDPAGQRRRRAVQRRVPVELVRRPAAPARSRRGRRAPGSAAARRRARRSTAAPARPRPTRPPARRRARARGRRRAGRAGCRPGASPSAPARRTPRRRSAR